MRIVASPQRLWEHAVEEVEAAANEHERDDWRKPFASINEIAEEVRRKGLKAYVQPPQNRPHNVGSLLTRSGVLQAGCCDLRSRQAAGCVTITPRLATAARLHTPQRYTTAAYIVLEELDPFHGSEE